MTVHVLFIIPPHFSIGAPYYYSLTIVIADKQNLSHVVIESTAPKLFLYDETSKVEIIRIKYKLPSEQT